MADTKDIIEKASAFLKQQREMYGDFSVQEATSSQRTEKVQENVIESETAEIKSESNISAQEPEKSFKAKEQVKPEMSLEDRINNCETLEELRALCEESDVLKTDLDDTNLVFGVGNPNADLMLIGEAPGKEEDKQGEPFVGQAGQLLNKIMEAIDFKREDIYITNIVKHRPPNNRDPKPEERQQSLPFLMRQIELVDPKLILCLGRISANTLLGEEASLKSLRQKFHPFHGRELMATYHPAALLRNPQWKRPTWEDVQMLRKRYDELTNS